jgi:hypothetical protein
MKFELLCLILPIAVILSQLWGIDFFRMWAFGDLSAFPSGILLALKETPQYDLILFSKHILWANQSAVINALTSKYGDAPSPLVTALEDDKPPTLITELY